MFKFNSMDSFWEAMKAQGVQTARAWESAKHQEYVRSVDHELAAHLDALLVIYKTDVEA